MDLGILFHSTPALYVKELLTKLDLGVGTCRSLSLWALLRPRALLVSPFYPHLLYYFQPRQLRSNPNVVGREIGIGVS